MILCVTSTQAWAVLLLSEYDISLRYRDGECRHSIKIHALEPISENHGVQDALLTLDCSNQSVDNGQERSRLYDVSAGVPSDNTPTNSIMSKRPRIS